MVMLFPLSFIKYGKKVKVVDAYLGGANLDSSVIFRGSAGTIKNVGMGTYYLDNYFGEKRLFKHGVIICIILLILAVGLSL